MKKVVLLYGLCGGLLIAGLKATEYRFLVVEHSVELYGGIIALVFAGVGIWFGLTLTRRVPGPGPDPGQDWTRSGPDQGRDWARPVADEAKIAALGLTPRELEILQQIATGKSTREIAGALFVSENTVKTHASRLFEKLNVRRRTQAVHVGKQLGLIP